MSKLSEMTAAGVTFEHAGRTYRLAPLTLRAQGQVDEWIEDWPLAKARKILAKLAGDGVPESVIKQVWVDAVREAKSGAYAARALTSMEGLRLMLTLSLRENHPDIAEDVVEAMMTPDRLEEIKDKLDKVNNLSEEAEDELGE